MASETDICNLGLLRTGVSQSIASPDEKNNEARVCKLLYPILRDFVLADVDWNFARRRATLARFTGNAPTNWSYAYALPDGCLAVRDVVIPGSRKPASSDRVPFEVAGGQLFCDQESVEIIYTVRVTDTSLFSPQFVSAMGWALVPELATGLVIKGDFATAGKRGYDQAVSSAIAADLQEGSDNEPDSDFVRCR